MFQRFFSPPDHQSFFLFGPRGTGKTTWLKAHYSYAIWIDLIDPELFRFYSAAPEKLKSVLAEKRGSSVMIDEVQKVPELLNVVHELIEQKRGLQFVLTGSSARKLRRHGVYRSLRPKNFYDTREEGRSPLLNELYCCTQGLSRSGKRGELLESSLS